MTARLRGRVDERWLAPIFIAAVPLLYGLVSVAIGQDANWDLRNYHLYNPWAFLHGRIDTDIGPAELPTYYNPLLDLPYHVLMSRIPPRLVAFLFGAFHGLCVLAVYRIGLLVLTGPSYRMLAVVLALFAGTDNTFTSEIGNTMGAATTAVLILTGVALALGAARRHVVPSDRGVPRSVAFAAAGLLVGLGVGLKLTNAPYAVGMIVAALVMPEPPRSRAVAVAWLVAGLGIGIAASYGDWFLTLWQHFGNPFYPQFNGIFHSPFAQPTMVVDDRFRPSGWIEALAFPFVFTALPIRIYEVPLVNLLWPVAYALGIACAIRSLRWRSAAGHSSQVDEQVARSQRFLLTFAGVGYLAWMAVFSIGRYLVPLNLLLPLLVWLLAHRLLTTRNARRVAGVALAASLISVVFNFRTWGTAEFGDKAFDVAAPPIDEPSRATVLVLTAPIAWILPHFPAELAYVSFGGTFPETPTLRARMASVIESRGGPVYAILPADEADDGSSKRSRFNRLLAVLDVRKDDLICRYAVALFDNSPYDEITFDGDVDAPGGTNCRFKKDADKRVGLFRDAPAIVRGLEGTGLSISLDRCTLHSASIGASPFEYRFCPVERTGPLHLD